MPTSRNEPRWLPLDVVVDTAEAVVQETGEPFGMRDIGLLESALASPRNHWEYGEDDILNLAIQLLLAIARNHPFVQGNKRTAFVSAEMFLQLNGYTLTLTDSDILGEALERLMTGALSEANFREAIQEGLRDCLEELPQPNSVVSPDT